MTLYIRRIINLEQSDYWIVQRVIKEKGFGVKGFSAALRLIIREWASANLLLYLWGMGCIFSMLLIVKIR